MDDLNKNKIKAEVLLVKYISGTASDNEISQLRQLADSSESFKKELEESEKVVRQLDSLESMKSVDTTSAFLKSKDRLRKYQQKNRWVSYWQKMAAVLIIPLIFVSVFQFLFQEKRESSTVVSQSGYNEIQTPSGIRSNFKLPDGTIVWLNGNTEIIYPIFFTGNERRIRLKGEAYFEVAKNPQKPFIIDVGTLHIQALGTAFNCMAYPEDNLIETSLSEGKVKIAKIINNKEEGEYILKPGQVLTYEMNSDKFYLKEENLDKYLSWRSGKFMFRNDPLEVVCRKLGRWFNADIVIENEKLKHYTFTGTFQQEGLREILELISLTSPLSYTISDRNLNEKNEYGTLKVVVKNK